MPKHFRATSPSYSRYLPMGPISTVSNGLRPTTITNLKSKVLRRLQRGGSRWRRRRLNQLFSTFEHHPTFNSGALSASQVSRDHHDSGEGLRVKKEWNTVKVISQSLPVVYSLRSSSYSVAESQELPPQS